jgi:taurine dioxygenase
MGGDGMPYKTFDLSRTTGTLGAEIHGINLARPLDDAAVTEIRQALLDHLVIFFADQQLTPEQHLAFGRRFGDLNVHDYVAGMLTTRKLSRSRKRRTKPAATLAVALGRDLP